MNCDRIDPLSFDMAIPHLRIGLRYSIVDIVTFWSQKVQFSPYRTKPNIAAIWVGQGLGSGI